MRRVFHCCLPPCRCFPTGAHPLLRPGTSAGSSIGSVCCHCSHDRQDGCLKGSYREGCKSKGCSRQGGPTAISRQRSCGTESRGAAASNDSWRRPLPAYHGAPSLHVVPLCDQGCPAAILDGLPAARVQHAVHPHVADRPGRAKLHLQRIPRGGGWGVGWE